MITKALIKSKIGNKYRIRIPLFEYAGAPQEYIEEATLCYTPGNLEGYKIGDVVFIGFENNRLDKPVILGKLYLGPETEATNGSNCATLTVTQKASLPVDTTIGNSTFITLNDVLNSYYLNSDRITRLEREVDQLTQLVQQSLSNTDE